MTKTIDSYPLIRTTSVCFTGAGEQKGKVMKQQIIKISLKALQMLFKAKTLLGTRSRSMEPGMTLIKKMSATWIISSGFTNQHPLTFSNNAFTLDLLVHGLNRLF